MNRLAASDFGSAGKTRHLLTSPVSVKYLRHYASVSLAVTNDGISITECYLRSFLYPVLYHLLQIMGSYHFDIEIHMSLLSNLHNQLARFQKESYTFGG